MNRKGSDMENKLNIARKFILKIALYEKPTTGDDFIFVCKECYREGYQRIEIKHKSTCVVGKVVNQIIRK